jgi:CheY-like chemotaxis protein
MNILIVDDDGDDREIFCETLTEIVPELNCIVFPGGEEAIKYLRNPPAMPQYIFLDVYMNGMDGKECLLKIRSMKELGRIPIVMYSSSIDKTEETIYKKLGASHFINKTGSLDELKTQLRILFNV